MASRRAIEYASQVDPAEINGDGVTFAEYLTRADTYCKNKTGVSIFDLPDAMWWDYWQAGTYRDVVDELLAEEGYDLDDDDEEEVA